MLLRNFLNTMNRGYVTVYDGTRSLTLHELRRLHHAHLDSQVVTHHMNGRLHKAEIRTADLGLYLFTVRYFMC